MAREIAGANSAPATAPPRKAGEAQGADDETLPVTGDGECGGDHQQRQVQQVSVHEPYGIGRS